MLSLKGKGRVVEEEAAAAVAPELLAFPTAAVGAVLPA
jgi:hypothetical protein